MQIENCVLFWSMDIWIEHLVWESDKRNEEDTNTTLEVIPVMIMDPIWSTTWNFVSS